MPIATTSRSGAEVRYWLFKHLDAARDRLTSRGVTVALSVPPGLAMPRGGPERIRRAVGSLLDAAAGEVTAGPKAALCCERKPVLLRGKAGEEIRRDFAMIAVVHANTIAPERQQRVLQGADAGPLGEAWRTVREVGGFMRFSTLASGELETRLFLPLS